MNQSFNTENEEYITPLEPHSYPKKITVPLVICFLIFCYFFIMELPQIIQVIRLCNKAEYMYQKSNYTHAIGYYKQALELAPDSTHAKIYLAKNYFATRQNKLAVELLKSTEFQTEEWKIIASFLPMEYYSDFKQVEFIKIVQVADNKFSNRLFDDAIHWYSRALAINPESKTTKIALAKSFFSLEDEADQWSGVVTLEGISLNQSEWDDLVSYMPKEYHVYFGRS